MFLDDKLKEILEEGISNDTDPIEICNNLINECISRIPHPDTCSIKDWINSIKQIENGWKLFCKKNPHFNSNGFRKVMMNRGGDNPTYEPIYKELGWL